MAGPAHATTFTVVSTGDEAAAGLTNDNSCVSTAGPCTLRAAIREALDSPGGPHVIRFNVAGTITLGSALPGINKRVTIDATTGNTFWPGTPPYRPVVELNAAGAGGTGLLLDVGSDGSTIRGLCINRTGGAIRITGSSNNIIAGNFLGTNLAGSAPGPAPLNQVGVFVGFSGVTNANRIGGIVDADRNIISGNSVDGIQIFNGSGTTASNLVQGNYIGLDVIGNADVGNSNQGVSIFGGADNNTVGGNNANARNVISGNNNDGILIADAGTTGNIVQGNYIGTNAGGTAAVPNTRGIELANSASSTIGGTGAAGNLISGNLAGITHQQFQQQHGPEQPHRHRRTTGTSDLGNSQHGVAMIGGASTNLIGGGAGLGNVVSGNNESGVVIRDAGTAGNQVQGNLIGTNAGGTGALANNERGVLITAGSTSNTVGGSAAARNVISGNALQGVLIDDSNTNVVASNYIGTNAAGNAAVANNSGGILITNTAQNNIIGGTAADAGNRIAYNLGGAHGVSLDATAGVGNAILRNEIFLNAGLGIDLPKVNGVDSNDGNDVDSGPNDLMNFPDLHWAVPAGGGTVAVAYQLDAPNGWYHVEFFTNPSGTDATNNGEGEVFAGSVPSESDWYPLGLGNFVSTATANPGNGSRPRPRRARPAPALPWRSTSEFSNFVTVAATAVKLVSFTAAAGDQAVDLAWRTGSEVDNLGFHLYRSPSDQGPWTRLTSSLVPGQGFSPMGASYSWRDTGLANGTRYFYRLEDVDTRSVSTFHGPVSAVPVADATEPPSPGGGSSSSGGSGSTASSPTCPAWALAQLGASASSYTCETHGESASSSFRILSRTAGSALVELETPGFLTARDATGRVRALLPGFDTVSDPLAPALPTKRAVLDGVVGRQARIRMIDARENRFFSGLTAAAVGYPQALVAPDGTVRPGRREAELAISRGAYPLVQARLAGEGFQGETKTLALELMPLRYDASRGALVLSRRLTVRVDFAGAVASEVGRGGFGRRVPRSRPDSNAYAFLATSRKGLYAVSFESLFPGRSRPLDPSLLRLTRDSGRVLVPFHVGAPGLPLRPGKPSLLPRRHCRPLHLLLVRGRLRPRERHRWGPHERPSGSRRRLGSGLLQGLRRVGDQPLLHRRRPRRRGPVAVGVPGRGDSTTKTFALDGLDSSSSETAHLVVSLQGGSDAVSVVDHHVQVFVGNALVGNALVAEATFDGAVPHKLEAEVPVSLLQAAGTNELRILNVGDTGVYSRVLLDRFEIAYPQTTAARSGLFEGRFSSGGTAEVTGLVSPAALVDATSASWLTGFDSSASLRFHAEADHRYLAVSEEALLSPRVFFPQPSARLRSAANQADYLLIAPQAFLPAAQPLLDRRASQGLTTFAASLEEITSAFGAGQPSGEALRDFLSFAYHHWTRPSPRYVLLLGDSNYDPRHFSASSQPSPLPYLLQKTSFIWTASDPALVALNGDDPLPDLAIGRLPATTLEQAQTLVAKILDWEDQGQNFDGKVALVADNPDPAGDFEADIRDIESSFLTGRNPTQIFYSQIGNPSLARAEILDAMNSGLSVISYVGHGGGGLWADENILNSGDAKSLLAQPRQPFMLTMNCLNGYFIAASYESLAEGFLKGQGKGTIAAFSPSGLSLDGPAHLYHRAVWQEITSGQHERLGDAILAAQKTYAQSGAFPELLSVYHLFGDPAMRTKP